MKPQALLTRVRKLTVRSAVQYSTLWDSTQIEDSVLATLILYKASTLATVPERTLACANCYPTHMKS